jgi:hypothetical protein
MDGRDGTIIEAAGMPLAGHHVDVEITMFALAIWLEDGPPLKVIAACAAAR